MDVSESDYSDASTCSTTPMSRACYDNLMSDSSDDGCLIFNVRSLSWKRYLRPKIGYGQNSSWKRTSLVHLLRQRQLNPHGNFISNQIRFRKRLYKMNVRKINWNPRRKQTIAEFFQIDRKGMYLGLSHDSTYLVELCVEGVDSADMIYFFDQAAATGDETTFRFVIHYVTPQHFYPCNLIDLGRRSLYSVFYAGFSLDQKLFVSHCFNSSEHKYFKDGTYTDSVLVDVALLTYKIHISLQIVVNFSVKKRQLSKHSYFRIFNGGFLFDTGMEIIAVTFSNQLPINSSDSRATYCIFMKDYGAHVNVNRSDTSGIHGIFLRNVSAQSCICKSYTNKNDSSESGQNSTTAPIYGLQLIRNSEKSTKSKCFETRERKDNSRNFCSFMNSSESFSTLSEKKEELSSNGGMKQSTVYMTETFLNADRVINPVVRSLLKNKLQNSKFMGITASEAYIVGIKDYIANILVTGVIEVQDTRYVFLRLTIELDWDLNKPDKMSLVNLTMKEINWMTATRGDWHPLHMPMRRTVEDRLMTNDVTESLSWLTGSFPGGIIFSA